MVSAADVTCKPAYLLLHVYYTCTVVPCQSWDMLGPNHFVHVHLYATVSLFRDPICCVLQKQQQGVNLRRVTRASPSQIESLMTFWRHGCLLIQIE